MIPKSHEIKQMPLEGRTAVFAGTFDPFTIGHADIVERGLEIFDNIAVCVGVNIKKARDRHNAEERAESIRKIYADNPRVTVNCWMGLTAEFAKHIGAKHLLRGVRSVKDNDYERDMADANREMFGLDTVVLFTEPSLSFVSSSLVRELEAYGQDVSRFLP